MVALPRIAAEPWTLHEGDCLEMLRTLPDNSIEACVTDPPYGLSQEPDMVEVLTHWLAGDRYEHASGGFMGKSWDSFVPGPEYWREVYRVMKPGAHLLCFAGTRTQDLMGVSLRLAGFTIRDTLVWIHGQGFPKSLDVSKAIDKAAGAKRKIVGVKPGHESLIGEQAHVLSGGWERPWMHDPDAVMRYHSLTAPATDAAAQWDGFGTALKPAQEPIILARKPLAAGTVAGNVLEWETGALNIGATRVATDDDLNGGGYSGGTPKTMFSGLGRLQPSQYKQPAGRWPPNLLLSHSVWDTPDACSPDCPVRVLGEQSGYSKSTARKPTGKALFAVSDEGRAVKWNPNSVLDTTERGHGDTGTAARFFPNFPPDPADAVPFLYAAKASRSERNQGCDGLPERKRDATKFDGAGGLSMRIGEDGRQTPKAIPQPEGNHHPTVKSQALMSWLVRLITPPGGIVLDPFMGSGSTGVAAIREGFGFIGIERESEYMAIARARIEHAARQRAA